MNHPFPGIFKDAPPQRILIVRLSAHGDVIQTLPLLTALRQNWPDARIGWLTEPSALPLLRDHPLIDHLHVAQRPRWLKALRNPTRWPSVADEAGSLLRELRTAGYAVSLDTQGLLKSALWPWLARIPVRLGFRATREGAASFYTHTLPRMNIRDPQTPAVQRYLDFARALGGRAETPQFILPPVPPDACRNADMLLAPAHPALGNHPPESRRWIALAPFTRWPSKHWEAAYWSRLVDILVELDAQPVLLGGPGDRPAADALLASLSPAGRDTTLDLVGRTEWPEMRAILERVALLVGPDSAPLHLADALGRPVVGLFGPTAPGRTGPIGRDHSVLSTALPCQPCFERRCKLKTHDCMVQLTPEVVGAVIRRQLSLTGDVP
jgi:heptosyltransferase-1